MKSNILITGGAGLIGTALIKKLHSSFNLIVIDVSSLHPSIKNSCSYIKADIIYSDYIEKLTDITGVIHFAAVSRVINGEKFPLQTWETNVGATQKILNHCSTLEHPPWIIYGSSREVYGEPKSLPVTESHPALPINRYGISKLSAEMLVHHYSRTTQARSIIFRFSNVYGSIHDQLDRVIPKFVLRGLQNLPLELHGPSNTFDFTHVTDTVDGIIKGIKNLSSPASSQSQQNPKLKPVSHTLNLCTGTGTTLEELGNLVIQATGSTGGTTICPARNYDVQKFTGSYALAQQVLGYKPKIALYDGIMSLVELFKIHKPEQILKRSGAQPGD